MNNDYIFKLLITKEALLIITYVLTYSVIYFRNYTVRKPLVFFWISQLLS